MEGLASLSVKSVLPNSCYDFLKIKECLVDIENREVKDGDDQFLDEKQTLLLKLEEPGSRDEVSIMAHFYVNNIIKKMLKTRNEISIVADIHVNNIIKEMLKSYHLISLKNLLGTKPLRISVLIFGEPSNAEKSIKGFHDLPRLSLRPLPPLLGPTDITRDDLVRQSAQAWKPATTEGGSGRGFCSPTSQVVNCRDAMNFKQEHLLLVLATMTAAVTFLAACTFAGVVSKSSDIEKKRDSSLTGSFVLFNSAGFIASVAVIISLLHHFPLKPWPQISVSSWFGSYMFLIMKLSPHEALLLFCVSVPFLVLAAVGKLFRFSQ